ncbi:MAG: EthD family reductase [Bradyrhizobium sp.]
MIRVTVSYPAKANVRFDHDYYHDTHRALLRERLTAHGLAYVEIDRCLSDGAGNPPPVVAVAHMVFASLDGFQAGMAAHGKEIMADVARYTDITPNVLISEVVR